MDIILIIDFLPHQVNIPLRGYIVGKITNYIFHTLKKVLINLEEQKKKKSGKIMDFPFKVILIFFPESC